MTNEEVAKKIKLGESEKIIQLWEMIRRFAVQQARRWVYLGRGGVTLEDLEQIAFLAMLDALKSWKAEAGAFLTWYGFKLKTAFTEATRGRTRRDNLDPLDTAISIDTLIDNGNGDLVNLADMIPDAAAEMDFAYIEERDFFRRRREALNSVLENLPQEQSRILKIRYYANLSVSQAAKQLNMDSAEVRRTEHKGLLQLRKPNVRRKLIEYL